MSWDATVEKIAFEIAVQTGVKSGKAHRLATFAVRTVRHDIADLIANEHIKDAHYYGDHIHEQTVTRIEQDVRGYAPRPVDSDNLD